MGADCKTDFFYRGTLGKEHALLLVNHFHQKGLTAKPLPFYPRQIEQALIKVETEKSACILFDLLLEEENKEMPIYLSFYQEEKSEIFTISIMTSLSYLGYKEGKLAFSNLCEEIYYLTKPLIGTGYYLEFHEEDYAAVEKFHQTGKLQDLIVNQTYIFRPEPEIPGKQLVGSGPHFYPPQALQELQQLGIKIDPNAKKLKDGGLLDGELV